jgi:hypothetical protein
MARSATWNTAVIGSITAAGLGVLVAGSLADRSSGNEQPNVDADPGRGTWTSRKNISLCMGTCSFNVEHKNFSPLPLPFFNSNQTLRFSMFIFFCAS